MTLGLKRSLLAVAVSAAFVTTALAGPAEATKAGKGSSYASSVATTITPAVVPGGKRYTFRATLYSTSSAVKNLHGKITLRVVRVSDGKKILSSAKTVDNRSGKTFSTTSRTKNFTPGTQYRLDVTFSAKSKHIEKSSSTSATFTP